MRKLFAYTLSVASFVWAADAIADAAARSDRPIPRIFTTDGTSPPGTTSDTNSARASARGHGKIDSPRGALTAKPEATGTADIQFDCSDPGGGLAPSGSTHFRFKAGDLDFRATSHDRLAVSGGSVQIVGAGTVNKVTGFRFVLSATHGATDRLRMRITNQVSGAVVYDSQRGESEAAPPTAALSNGRIDLTAPAPQAQKAARASPTAARSTAPLGFELGQNFPNPFQAGTCLRFTLPERSHLRLMVHDIAGRQIATLAVGAWDAGSHVVGWSGRTDADQAAPRGVYFVRMTAGLMGGEQRFVSIRKMILD